MEKLAKSKARIAEFGEVFTPRHIVRQMCDMLQERNRGQDIFSPSTTFLEPACGEGAFLLKILRRKFERCKTRKDYTVALRSVYGIELQADNVEATIKNITSLCRSYFRPTKGDLQIISDHIIQGDGLKIMKLLEWAQREKEDAKC